MAQLAFLDLVLIVIVMIELIYILDYPGFNFHPVDKE